MAPVRRFGSEREPLRDPGGRYRWGDEALTNEQELWSILHMSEVGGVALPDPYIGRKPLAMMIGLWTDHH